MKKSDKIVNYPKPYHPYWFSIILLYFGNIQVLNCILCGIKKVLKSLKFDLVNSAETLIRETPFRKLII